MEYTLFREDALGKSPEMIEIEAVSGKVVQFIYTGAERVGHAVEKFTGMLVADVVSQLCDPLECSPVWDLPAGKKDGGSVMPSGNGAAVVRSSLSHKQMQDLVGPALGKLRDEALASADGEGVVLNWFLLKQSKRGHFVRVPKTGKYKGDIQVAISYPLLRLEEDPLEAAQAAFTSVLATRS